MEGILIFPNGTVQLIGQVRDTSVYIPLLETLVQELKVAQHKRQMEQLKQLSAEDLQAELNARASE